MEGKIEQLEAELSELRTRLAEARREARAQPVKNYALRRADGTETTLAALFGDKDDLIVIHNMGRSCPYCTLWADGFNGIAAHMADRAGFVICSPDAPEVQREFASSRGWRFPMVSGREFTEAMGFMPEGKPWPGASGFHRIADGSIVRTGKAIFGPGDDFCAAWHLMDLIGGDKEWEPKYSYPGSRA